MDLYLSILKLFLKYEVWKVYHEHLDREYLRQQMPEVLRLFHAVDSLWKKETQETDELGNFHKELRVVDLEASLYEAYPKADKTVYTPLLQRVTEAPDDAKAIRSYLQSVRTRELATQLAFQALDVGEGKGSIEDLRVSLLTFNDALGEAQEVEEVREDEWVDDDIETLYKNAVAEPGLAWRLKSLRRSLGPLRKGDFGFIFARPETGKTTFLASEVTHFASQTDRPILWINNEEQNDKVLLRCYEAALGAPLEKITLDFKRAREYYEHRTGRRIKLPRGDCNSRRGIERLCERAKPALVVVDQLDKVAGFDGEREDLRMGSIYQWARDLAKRYCPVIGVSQSDGSGEGQKWLNMGNVANAKTAKQAEADWILGIGLSYLDPPNVRGLSICKNKLVGGEESIPSMRHGKWEVLIEPEIARYRDIHEEQPK